MSLLTNLPVGGASYRYNFLILFSYHHRAIYDDMVKEILNWHDVALAYCTTVPSTLGRLTPILAFFDHTKRCIVSFFQHLIF